MRTFLVLTVAMVICASASSAWAQPAAGKAAAEQLFQEGRALMQKEQYEEAIVKFHASLDLDPGSGTLGNLALCYERVGKLASAWGQYREAVVRAEREGNAERAKIARDRAAALEPRLPRLLIRLSSSQAQGGVIVERDGAVVPATVLGTAVYVDPGKHEITATAPWHERFSLTVTLSESEQRTVEIPALEPVSAPRPAPAAPPGAAETGVLSSPPAHAGEPPGNTGRGRRIAGVVVAGAGLTTLAVALGVGATAVSSWEDAFDSGACDADTLVCTPRGQEQTDTARNRARLSNILVGAGLTAVAAGAVLYFTAPRPGEKRSTRIVPFTAGDSVGVAVTGGF